jgi:glutaredoxin
VPAERTIVLYSRPGCHLCDEARAVLLRERARHPFGFQEVDIEGDDSLELSFGLRIPVVEIDGHEAFELVVDPARLRAALDGGPDREGGPPA